MNNVNVTPKVDFLTIHVFLDTNVIIHCKSFTEIDWEELFKEFGKKDIKIVIPYIVNKELDGLKGQNKKARNVQSKLRDLRDTEFKNGITLNITVFPTTWNSLEPQWAENLDQNDPDCKIIAEILVFKKNHLEDDVFFITGDNSPYFLAKELGINTIFWRDDQYLSLFKPNKPKYRGPNRLTDLKICFENAVRK